MRGRPAGLVAWWLGLAAAEAIAVVVLWRFFVLTERGQLLETVSLAGNSIGQARVADLVDTTLNAISVVSVIVATASIGFLALLRGRIAVGAGAILLIAGANVTTQLLKQVMVRPELGVDVERAAAGNSWPSGHTTIAASVAVALVLVLPSRARGVGAVLGATVAAVTGAATLSAGWHRPSDSVAAILIVAVWAGVACAVILLTQRQPQPVQRLATPHRLALAILGVAAIVLLAGAAIALRLTDQVVTIPPDDLGRRRLFAAYAGGALGVAGTMAFVMATVLATVHRVVPGHEPTYAAGQAPPGTPSLAYTE